MRPDVARFVVNLKCGNEALADGGVWDPVPGPNIFVVDIPLRAGGEEEIWRGLV